MVGIKIFLHQIKQKELIKKYLFFLNFLSLIIINDFKNNILYSLYKIEYN